MHSDLVHYLRVFGWLMLSPVVGWPRKGADIGLLAGWFLLLLVVGVCYVVSRVRGWARLGGYVCNSLGYG
jgi:hypothetical protein